jgi:DNA modification methylase
MVLTDPPYGINLDTDYTYKAKGKRGNIYNKVIGDDKNFNPSFIFDFFGYIEEIFLFGGNYYADKLGDLTKSGWFVWDKTLKTNQDTGFAGQFEIVWSKQKHRQEIIRVEWFRFFGLQKEDIKKRVHPTQKPVELFEWFIKRFSKQNIIDLFLGSGATLIACEKMNRICYGMEISPHYCDVIVERWCQYTGTRDIIKNGEPIKWEVKTSG